MNKKAFTSPSRGMSKSESRTTTSKNDAFSFSCERYRLTRGRIDNLNKKCAFTLAEVLITLGIIGIVAAMTLPALTTYYRKQEATARLKKFYSAMSQAITLSEVNNGPVMYWNKAPIALDGDGNSIPDVNKNLTWIFYNQYLAKYLKTIKVADCPNHPSRIIAYFPDGSSSEFFNGSCIDITFDINGDTKPNINGSDQFRFLLCLPPNNKDYHGQDNIYFGVYAKRNTNTREGALTKCEAQAEYCSILLQMDNWEFKKDYPHKI